VEQEHLATLELVVVVALVRLAVLEVVLLEALEVMEQRLQSQAQVLLMLVAVEELVIQWELLAELVEVVLAQFLEVLQAARQTLVVVVAEIEINFRAVLAAPALLSSS
jgi:hypothetical protein